MKKIIIIIGLLACSWSLLEAQGIRKHYTELTDLERIAYRVALNTLISQGDTEDFAGFHADPDQDGVNGNLTFAINGGPDTDSPIHGVEAFLPWHRQFILEFEWLLQAEDDNITIPYWDWTGDSDPNNVVTSETANGPLWNNAQIGQLGWTDDFLDDFNGALGLGRQLSGGLPTSQLVSDAINVNNVANFGTFRGVLEGPIHGPPHNFVGGIMGNVLFSPRDPVFYFHHAMVDKIWQDWEEIAGNNSSFNSSTMPTFDGTVAGVSNINPNNIADSRDLGVFYSDAQTGVATLEQYSVTNNVLNTEKFIYQFEVVAENDFIVPSGNDAEFRSCNRVLMKDKFLAESGSHFIARIDTDCDFSTTPLVQSDDPFDIAPSARQKRREVSNITFSDLSTIIQGNDISEMKLYPNPVSDLLNIEVDLLEPTDVRISLYNNLGQLMKQIERSADGVGFYKYEMPVNDLPAGAYFIELKTSNNKFTKPLNIIH